MADLPDKYQVLYTMQVEIRPTSIFDGLLCTTWLNLQEAHLKRNSLPHSYNQAFTGLKALLNLSIHHMHDVWFTQNSHLQVTNPQQSFCHIHSHLLKQVQALYDSAPYMLIQDQEIFAKPFEVQEQHSTWQLKQFYA